MQTVRNGGGQLRRDSSANVRRDQRWFGFRFPFPESPSRDESKREEAHDSTGNTREVDVNVSALAVHF